MSLSPHPQGGPQPSPALPALPGPPHPSLAHPPPTTLFPPLSPSFPLFPLPFPLTNPHKRIAQPSSPPPFTPWTLSPLPATPLCKRSKEPRLGNVTSGPSLLHCCCTLLHCCHIAHTATPPIALYPECGVPVLWEFTHRWPLSAFHSEQFQLCAAATLTCTTLPPLAPSYPIPTN